MLRRLRIENLVLIHEAGLAFAPGLNAITGETGAGKTILAQAVGLLLGARGDAALVGPDGDEAYVEVELDSPPGFFEDEETSALAELRPEDEEGLVLARRVFPDGRTRAYAWGRSAGSPGPRISSTCSTVSPVRSSFAVALLCVSPGASSGPRAAGTKS